MASVEQKDVDAMNAIYSEILQTMDTNPEIRGILDKAVSYPRHSLLRRFTRYVYYNAHAKKTSFPDNIADAIHHELAQRAVGFRQEAEEAAQQEGRYLGDTSEADWDRSVEAAAAILTFHDGEEFRVYEDPKPHEDFYPCGTGRHKPRRR